MTTFSETRGADSAESLRDRLAGVGDSLKSRAADAGEQVHESLGRVGASARDLVDIGGRRARDTSLRAAQTVRQRPLAFGLAAALGLAAVAFLAFPRTRRLAAQGGPRLWTEFRKRRSALHL